VPLLGIASMFAIVGAAWSPQRPPRKVALDGWRTLVTPSLLALVACGLLVADHFHRTVDAAVWLSAAALVAVLGRMALTFVENNRLHATRQLALTDELTGLPNRRRWSTSIASRSSTTRSATMPVTFCSRSSGRACSRPSGKRGWSRAWAGTSSRC
jgi:hypothetical protein